MNNRTLKVVLEGHCLALGIKEEDYRFLSNLLFHKKEEEDPYWDSIDLDPLVFIFYSTLMEETMKTELKFFNILLQLKRL